MDYLKYMLIVDDIEVNRRILSEQFLKNYHILEAENGEDAMRILYEYKSKIAIVMLDIIMPKMNGFEVIQKMKCDEVLREIPIIVSTSDEEDYELDAIAAGATDYIKKPTDPRLIKVRVENAINIIKNTKLKISNDFLRIQKNEEKKYKTILKNTNTALVEFDENFENSKYDEQISKLLFGKYKDRNFVQVLKEEGVANEKDIEKINQFIEDYKKSDLDSSEKCNIQLKNRYGNMRWFRICIVKNASGRHHLEYIMTVNDVNDEMLYQNELQYIAEYDKLTGIYNKEKFCKKALQLINERQNEKFMIVSFDIEKFKIINDIFGHEKGDELLKDIAIYLSRFIKDKGVYARLQSDIFAICLPYSQQNIDEMIEQSSKDLDKYLSDFEIVICFGIYIVEDYSLSVDNMLDRANLALKTVKGYYTQAYAIYNESLRNELLEHQEITRMMHGSLVEGQFSLNLQPKCRISTGKIIGAEALVRWHHPVKGMIYPSQFIPLFEKNGFIIQLDRYVWEETCKLIRKWIDNGDVVIPISVNISRVNIYNKTLCDIFLNLIEKYDIPKNLLELEITESAYTDDPILLQNTIAQLRKCGFTLLLDDFGSGYSALNMLKDINVDILKIDLHFLYGKDENGRGGRVLSSVVRMAKLLEIQVIAEGVETLEQTIFLKSIGCDNVQGYYFYKPMSVEKFEELKNYDSTENFIPLNRLPSVHLNSLLRVDGDINILLSNIIGGVGIFEITETSFEPIRVNDEFIEILGYTNDYFYSKDLDFHKGLFDKFRKTCFNFIKEAKKTGNVVTCEYHRAYSGEKELWIKVKIRFLSNSEDDGFYFISISDITSCKKTEEKMTVLLEKYKLILENTSLNVWDYDLINDRIIVSNHDDTIIENATENILKLGYVHPDSEKDYNQMTKKVFNGDSMISGTLRTKNKNNNAYCYSYITYITIFDETEKPYKALGVSIDVTAEREALLAYEREVQFRKTISLNVYATYVFNVTKQVIEERHSIGGGERDICNGMTYKNFFKQASERVIDNPQIKVTLGNITTSFLLKAFKEDKKQMNFEYKRKNSAGDEVWTALEMHMLSDAKTSDILLFIYMKNIDKAKRKEENLVKTAERDLMTDLFNKVSATKKIKDLIASSTKTETKALIMFDLDNFKLINDKYGHIYGDEVLIEFSQILKSVFSSADVIGRFGGDEFFVFYKNTSKQKIEDLVVKFLNMARQDHIAETTVGIAFSNGNCDNSEYMALLSWSDSALYKAKRMGKNRYYIYKKD